MIDYLTTLFPILFEINDSQFFVLVNNETLPFDDCALG